MCGCWSLDRARIELLKSVPEALYEFVHRSVERRSDFLDTEEPAIAGKTVTASARVPRPPNILSGDASARATRRLRGDHRFETLTRHIDALDSNGVVAIGAAIHDPRDVRRSSSHVDHAKPTNRESCSAANSHDAFAGSESLRYHERTAILLGWQLFRLMP